MEIITLMPTRGVVLTEVQQALDNELCANRQIPVIIRSWDMPLPLSRNYLVESALKIKNWTHALLLDDDVILPDGGLKELIDMDCDVAIIDYPMHSKKNGKFVGTAVTDKDKSVAWAGLGATLVKREVFNKIPQPWFIFTNHSIKRTEDGYIGFYAGQPDGQNRFSGGEDVHFFLQCRKYNFKIKLAKSVATHAHIESFVSPVQNMRYQLNHKIVKVDKIEGEII